MTVRISANVIALNEERNIAACLGSLGWADEIVVVDGGSQDRTVQFARRFTDRVLVHPFDCFAQQRNRAIDQSSGDWIFSIDADECVSTRLAREVRASAAGATPPVCGFWVPIRSRIFGRRFRYSGTYGERKLRLFRRDAGRWQGAVHEVVALNGCAGQLVHAIDHESTPDIDTYLHKLIRYSSLDAERLFRAGSRPGRWRVAMAPFWTFAKLYFLKCGIRDGAEGFRFCLLSAWSTWITHQKLAERWRARPVPHRIESDCRLGRPVQAQGRCKVPRIPT